MLLLLAHPLFQLVGACTMQAWVLCVSTGMPSGGAQVVNADDCNLLACVATNRSCQAIRNVVAHGHDLRTEVFLRLNLYTWNYEVGSWDGSTDTTWQAVASIPAEDVGCWVHLAGV